MMKGIFKPRQQGKTPYEETMGAFNEMYANYVQQAHYWRIACFGSIGVALLSVGVMAYQTSQQKIVPYAVEFNEHSEPVRVTRADVMQQPNSDQIRAALRNWLIGARTVYIDRRAQKSLMDSTYAATMPGSIALSSLTDFHLTNNPYVLSETKTVEIAVNNVRSISDKTWLIEWTETTKEVSGRTIDARRWQGSFTVEIVPPTTEAQVFINPTGMLVSAYSWGERQ